MKKKPASTTTKRRLFDAALDLFSSYGYSAVGIRDIASAVYIQPPSLYYYYDSKDAILVDIYNSIHELSIANSKKLCQVKKITYRGPLLATCDLWFPPFHDCSFDQSVKILRVLLMEYPHDERALNEIQWLCSLTAKNAAYCINRAIKQGEIAACNIESVINAYLSACLSAIFPINGSPASIESWRQEIATIIAILRKLTAARDQVATLTTPLR